jgi:hypothetical protein
MRTLLQRLCCVLTLLGAASAHAQSSYTQGGYADRTSVPAGGTISFRIATATSPFDLQIVNLAHPADVLATISGLTSAANDCAGLWQNGCGWAVTTTFTIPTTWPSGYYAAKFPTSIGTRNIAFVVRAANPGLASPIVVVSPTNTWQAYNNFGGKSVYDSLSTNGQRANIVSWNRPYFDNFGLGRYPAWEQYLVDWLTAENRPFEVITDDDLANPTILSQYKVAVMAGHSEYWTLPMRQSLASLMAGGGHVAVFSGNTMWWQARADLTARQFTVYKDASLDPFTGSQNSLVTVNFYNSPVYNPESLILGSSFLHGGYANVSPGTTTPLPVEQRTPYTVREASSFVFNGTGLLNGDTFGRSAAGTEVDGVVFNTLPEGTLLPDGSDGAPLNYRILATVPGWSGYGTIGFLVNPNGSAIFNAASRDWLRGLSGSTSDPAVQQIARNVLDRFSTGQPFPYTARTSRYRTEDLFNTPNSNPGVLPGWSSNLDVTTTAQCAHEGPFGLQLQSTQWLVLHRNFTPTNVGRSAAVVSFSVNIDLLQTTPTFALPLVELVDKQATTRVYAAVELMTQPGGISVRLAIRRGDGSRSGTSNWVVMPGGWQPVMLAWSSPGTVELEVGSGIHLQLNNPHNAQTVNELYVEFPGTVNNTNGTICLDELRLRDTIDPPVSAQTSTITADPTTLVANGTATSNITVQLKGAEGDDLTRGGATVTLATTRGTLSAVTDDNDGTYTATLTASTSAGLATISGTVNGTPLTDTATVSFVPGPATSLSVITPANATSGTPFDVTVTASDANGNVATGYRGTVHFTSSDAAATLLADYTFLASDNGTHTFTVTLRTAGERTITVTDGSLTGAGNVTVARRATTTTLTSTPNPAAPGATVTLTATASAATVGSALTGTVAFNDGVFLIGSATLTGGTASISVSNLAGGSHALTATYSGDDTAQESTSDVYTQVITLPAPTGVDATPVTTTRVRITWSAVANAANYRVERSTNNVTFTPVATVNALTLDDTTVTANASYLYRVVAIDGGGNAGVPSARDVAATRQFVSDPQRVLRASHVSDLRTAINTFRASFGLGAVSYSRPTIPAGSQLKRSDVNEMRDAVNAARAAAGLPAFVWAETIAVGTPLKWSHFRELQTAIGAIAAAP